MYQHALGSYLRNFTALQEKTTTDSALSGMSSNLDLTALLELVARTELITDSFDKTKKS